MASDGYHESLDLLTEQTRNMHRAIVSLMEELEAIDWYQQRADACSDPHLQTVLVHNKNEEIEHATMVLEWIRRHNDHFDEMMRKYCSPTDRSPELRRARRRTALPLRSSRPSASAA